MFVRLGDKENGAASFPAPAIELDSSAYGIYTWSMTGRGEGALS
jgi:hypothetical protein